MSNEQSHRDIPEIARPAPDEPSRLGPSEFTRYDALLAVIPLVLLSGWLVGHVATVPKWVALGVGALVALPALVDGLILHPPE